MGGVEATPPNHALCRQLKAVALSPLVAKSCRTRARVDVETQERVAALAGHSLDPVVLLTRGRLGAKINVH
jgi:hypothetical protein